MNSAPGGISSQDRLPYLSQKTPATTNPNPKTRRNPRPRGVLSNRKYASMPVSHSAAATSGLVPVSFVDIERPDEWIG